MTDFTDKLDAYVELAVSHPSDELKDLRDAARAAVVALFDKEVQNKKEFERDWLKACDNFDGVYSENVHLRARAEAAEKENVALRNLADNLQPGPISEALAGTRYTLENRLRAELTELHSEFRQQNSDFGAALIALDDKRAELARVREALKLIASCESKFKGDVVDIAQAALKGEQ